MARRGRREARASRRPSCYRTRTLLPALGNALRPSAKLTRIAIAIQQGEKNMNVTRRNFLAGAGIAATAVLAGCGSSDGGSAAPSAPASLLPGLTVTDKSGQRISYTSTQSGNALTVCVGRFTASFRISLAALRQLRAEGIETITFQTILCSTTISLDELLAMGGEDAEAVLAHRFTDSSLTVG